MSKYTREDFDFLKQLGKGAYSEVFLTKYKKSGTHYATKVIKKDFVIKEKKINTVKMEKEVLNMLSHPNIISLFCTYQDKDHLYFVLELAPGGELAGIIEKYGPLSLDASRFYMAELIMGLEHIHSKNILHRDLKPENLILSEDLHLKITDFGTAKILKLTKPLTSDGEEFEEPVLYVKGTFVGTAHYVSPEILKDLPQSESSDIWALGCILYNFLTGKQLFDGESQYLIFQKITAIEREGLIIDDEEDLDPVAVDFIRQVCAFEAENRLGSRQRGGMSSLKQHPFFEGINFDVLQQMVPPLINERYAVSLNDRWSKFLMKNENVVYTALVIKRRRFTAKKRQLILTDKPRILYIDPEKMIVKGIIPWSNELYVVKKNSREFHIQTVEEVKEQQKSKRM
ncbi:3-phosphoinositide-dependent protein kinase-1 [Naegleria gruberi]|uniref:non-specific serine/threonine protein kinase n=1 Tax=Naegleria gruberi TaxID=5762 RepID=D2VUC2_NAEGR|nr:3-phosphoinositide-dependent protein kinase-1 [Naegleria gruberi]EFC39666.1 3-phosphoinositide-dependent protein kinase-1 [Naegleria gruberi]|eukprot:XP_002672410.1 3-phosphoinositide-dependent protein kinase-1 [Naegleria gruberi strain NEG-M]